MSVVVSTHNLGKAYKLGEINRKSLFKKREEFWALKDINLEVRDGDLVGIIGRNGAGKSTLLKILSRITAPTTGHAEIRGRLASLLEVGTGFVPQLTGRENVYMNGTILGMKKAEIDSRFDEIVAFSGVEEFLDTPVKRYSSGMKVRLAFAVAAHLDPDILIVDEVLAVGDASFQQKCIGKIDSSAKEGRTILFVSHNASAVEALCRRGIVLEAGGVIFDGTQTEALSFYAERGSAMMKPIFERTDHRGKGGVRVRNIRLLTAEGRESRAFPSGHDMTVEFEFESEDKKAYTGVSMEMTVSTLFETKVFQQSTKLTGVTLDPLPEKGVIRCRIPRLPLTNSSYKISYRLLANNGYLALDALDAAVEFHVEGGDYFGTGHLPPARLGPFLVNAEWSKE